MRIFLLGAAGSLASCASVFHHKARHASIILGTTLYIDGGEVSTWDGQGSGTSWSNLTTNEDPYTYSIDLRQPWSPLSVAVTEIPKTTATFQSGALWADDQTIYSYAGGLSLVSGTPASSVPPNQLLSYAPAGRWTQAVTTGNFSTLRRVQEGIYASGNGLGFALGGYRGRATIPEHEDIPYGYDYLGGMVMYNTSSQQWYNVSAGGYYTEKSSNGAAHFVPSFGTAGLFMAFGGQRPDGSIIPLDQISIFEPSSQQWRLQQTSGNIPPAVQNACAVGAAGDNGTYEVFLFGGLQQTSNNQRAGDGSVYILSLPSFNWFRVPATVSGRFRHSCNVANRQMISIGGIVIKDTVSAVSTSQDTGVPDMWTKGFGIFDMSSLQWKSDFDSNAAAYVTPDVVKAYIARNGVSPATWADATVQSWFASRSTDVTASSTPTSDGSTTGSGVSAGLLAGSIVGGIVALSLVAALIFLLRRRKKKSKHVAETHEPLEYTPAYSSAASYHKPQPGVYEVQGDSAHELGHGMPNPRVHEMAMNPVYELGDGSSRHKPR